MQDDWSGIAARRRQQIEGGADLTFTKVFSPLYQGVVDRLRFTSLVEVGCGTGHLSRQLSRGVERAYALEPSAAMHGVATEVLHGSGVVLLPAKVEEFQPDEPFGCVISHLCAHTTADLDGFVRACRQLLTESGTFVFSIPHPCFWNDYQQYFRKDQFDYVSDRFTYATLTISLDRESQMPGVPFHHRPLSRYVSAISAAGLYLQQFEEVFPTPEIQALYPEPWKRPHYCVFYTSPQRVGT